MSSIFKHIWISFFGKNNKIMLGRWNIKKNNNQINNIVDWANVDHCGSCKKI